MNRLLILALLAFSANSSAHAPTGAERTLESADVVCVIEDLGLTNLNIWHCIYRTGGKTSFYHRPGQGWES